MCVFQVDDVVMCAGQIALVPCTLQMVSGSVALQTRLCFSHVEKVLNAVDSNLSLNHVIHVHMYVTQRKHIPTVTTAWRRKLHSFRVSFISSPVSLFIHIHFSHKITSSLMSVNYVNVHQ